MLRIGLTGSLGSGKSTVASMFAAHGAHVLSSDEIGRQLMQPGEPVYAAIVAHFGPTVVAPDGSLDRPALARIVFTSDSSSASRIEELNAIVHPAVIARQAQLIEEIAAHSPHAVVLIESALIFETKHGGGETNSGGEDGWHTRFEKIILVRASEDLKIARFIQRSLNNTTSTPQTIADLTAEARRRLAQQIDDDRKAPQSDYILTNNGSLADLQTQVDALWPILAHAARTTAHSAR